LISNFLRVLNVVFFLLGNSSAAEFYMPTFRNTLSYEDEQCSETSAYEIQTPGYHPKERMKQGSN